MPRTIQISYHNLTLTTESQRQSWTGFREVENLFPGIQVLAVPHTLGSSVKLTGEDLPGINGIYPMPGKLASQSLTCRFLARAETPEEVQRLASNFTTFLYTHDEMRISYDNETWFRRMKYGSSEQYEIFEGTKGYDIEIVVTLLAIDSLIHQKSESVFNSGWVTWASRLPANTLGATQDTSQIFGFENPGADTFGTIEVYYTGVRDTILASTAEPATIGAPRVTRYNYVEITQNQVNWDRFSWAYSRDAGLSNAPSWSNRLILDGTTPSFREYNNSTSYDLFGYSGQYSIASDYDIITLSPLYTEPSLLPIRHGWNGVRVVLCARSTTPLDSTVQIIVRLTEKDL